MDDVKASRVEFSVHDGANTADVITSDAIGQIALFKLHKIYDFALKKVDLHSVIDVDVWMRVSDGPGVVSHNVGNLVWTHLFSFHLAELVLRFILLHLLQDETALHIVHYSVVLACLLN